MLRYAARITRWLRHAFHSRPRFLVSLIAAFITFFALFNDQNLIINLIISWNVFAWSYLLFLFQRIISHNVKDIRRLTKVEDESARMVIFFLMSGCCVSLLGNRSF
ncbi:MAG: hypothetical protein ACRCZ3_02020 [Providencia rustigianii]|uniref:hypothetical protein n=1 Tax=Providencia rustigianii TaxID=158850 RepID=UPI003F34BDC9